MPKCDFNKVALQITLRHGCFPVNLLHIFRTPFPKNTSGWLLLIDTTEHFREILYLLVSGKYFVNTLSVFIITCLIFYLV